MKDGLQHWESVGLLDHIRKRLYDWDLTWNEKIDSRQRHDQLYYMRERLFVAV